MARKQPITETLREHHEKPQLTEMACSAGNAFSLLTSAMVQWDLITSLIREVSLLNIKIPKLFPTTGKYTVSYAGGV